MICTVHIVLEGLPERVQEIADALDQAIPGAVDWYDYASSSGESDIVLKGTSSRELAVSVIAGELPRDFGLLMF